MSKKLVLSIEEDGSIYRGSKLIGKVVDGDVEFKHHAYRKHLEEIKLLLGEGDYDDEPVADIGLEPIVVPVPKLIEDEPLFDTTVDPVTPKELFVEGEGKWYGEENPPVVEWRKKYWSAEAFDDKYGHKEILLKEIYNKHNLIHDRNNTD